MLLTLFDTQGQYQTNLFDTLILWFEHMFYFWKLKEPGNVLILSLHHGKDLTCRLFELNWRYSKKSLILAERIGYFWSNFIAFIFHILIINKTKWLIFLIVFAIAWNNDFTDDKE